MPSLLQHNIFILLFSAIFFFNAWNGIAIGKISMFYREVEKSQERLLFSLVLLMSVSIGLLGMTYAFMVPSTLDVNLLIITAILLRNAVRGLVHGEIIIPLVFNPLNRRQPTTVNRETNQLRYYLQSLNWTGVPRATRDGQKYKFWFSVVIYIVASAGLLLWVIDRHFGAP